MAPLFECGENRAIFFNLSCPEPSFSDAGGRVNGISFGSANQQGLANAG
jgi:hypothetical protein